MLLKKNFVYYIGLIFFAALFLLLHKFTHYEFLLHLAAIPLEALAAVFIVEKFLEVREKQDKRRQLMFIKSHMFRAGMRGLFAANFAALKFPPINMQQLQKAGLEDLLAFRNQAEQPEYRSAEDQEKVILEYVKAKNIWTDFLDRAALYNFEDIVEDMIFILHFIQDVDLFKEYNPDKLFIREAGKNKRVKRKVDKILGDGIRKFLDYIIELKGEQPEIFDELLADYVFFNSMRKPADHS